MIVHLDMEKAHLNGALGFVLLAVLLAACVGLSLLLLHNPHKDLQRAVFATAERVRTYYRDRPGYWKLSTETAKSDNLLRGDLLKYKEYEFQIGQGADGAAGLPSDMSFDITAAKLNKSACISLSEMPLSESDKLALMKITITNEQNSVEFSWGGEHKLPIAKYSARSYCLANGNTIIWTFQ